MYNRRVSNKRKLRRAQAEVPVRAQSASALRKQTAGERFSRAGSDKLWRALLGWNSERTTRIWLAQSIHDAARAKERGKFSVEAALAAFAEQSPAKLEASSVSDGADVWLASGDEFDANDPAPKWHYLTNLAGKLGLGATTPEAYQLDWEAWCSLHVASAPRATLMSALAQAEQAAILLQNATRSERMCGLVNLSRAMWTAVAYGDDASFELLERAGTDWLANVAGKVRPV